MRFVLLLFAIALAQRGQTGQPIIPIGPFTGGMVTTRDAYNLSDQELTDALNTNFSNPGEIRCRYGADAVGTVAGSYVIGFESSNKRFGGSSDNVLRYPSLIATSGDSIRFHRVESSSDPTLIWKYPNSTEAEGVPSIVNWHSGWMFNLPTHTTSGSFDSLNCIRYYGSLFAKSSKIGVPTCTFSAPDTNLTGETMGDSGTYYYAVTFRREYTFSGKTYYEEGNSELQSVTTDSGMGIQLTGIAQMDSDWVNPGDPYNGGWYRIVYRSLVNGSTLYKIATIANDSTTWSDTVKNDDVNVFNPTYDEVKNNYCIDSLIQSEYLTGYAVHGNRLYIMSERKNNTGFNPITLYRTIPFTNQTPLLFNSTRKSTTLWGKHLYTNGLISCGQKSYSLTLNGIQQIFNPESSTRTEQALFNSPFSGPNCTECLDGELWAMTTRGELFSSYGGAISPLSVSLVDTTLLKLSGYQNQILNGTNYKSMSLTVARPSGKPIFFSSNNKRPLYAGLFTGSGFTWSRYDWKARSAAGNPTANQIVWIDTSTSKLLYWPSQNLIKKDYNGTDSANIKWSITTKWYGTGSGDVVKQLEKVVFDMALTDTMKTYIYWDGSSTVNDSGFVYSQDTIVASHSGDAYTWFPKRNNTGRYFKFRFDHNSRDYSKVRFRSAKAFYSTITY